MKKILPFKAIRYNQEKIGSMADVVTPPYDVISPEMQTEFYARSPVNFCRLDLPKEEGEARFEVVRGLFEKWMSDGTLFQDTRPGLYVHHHHFALPDGRRMVRKGFLAARRIEDFSEGGIKPHEKTLEGPKADRLGVTRATKTNLSPVFSLYSDPNGVVEDALERITQTTPVVDFVAHDNERHQLWLLTDAVLCQKIDDALVSSPLFIADGHHRYETALNYRGEVVKKHGDINENSAARFILMYFCSMQDQGMVILPIHRALHGLQNFDLTWFLERLAGFFDVQKMPVKSMPANLKQLAASGKSSHAFLLVVKNRPDCYLLSIAFEKWLATDVARLQPASLAKLDVTVLHQLIFGHVLGLSDESQARQENIIYWKSTEKALKEVESGECELTFIVNPTKLDNMEEVALSGQKMPQKSTYFFPKIISGLLLHSVDHLAKDGLDGNKDLFEGR